MKRSEALIQPVVLQANTIFETFRAFTPGQLSFLRAHGFKVATACSDAPGADSFFRNQGAEYHPIVVKRDIVPIADLRSFFSIIALLRRIRPDLLQGSTPKAAFLFLVAGWLLRVPSRLFFMRGVRSTGLTGAKKKVVKFMERISCAAAQQVLCTSPSVRDEIVRVGICPAGKASVLANGTGNGIDTVFFSPSAVTGPEKTALRAGLNIPLGALVLLFVGRIARDKGVVELASAWPAIKKQYPDAILVMVGGQEVEDPVPSEVIRTLEGDPFVRMVGNTLDARPYYAIANVFVLPTYREGIPIALLEASAMALPVLATRTTGCVDAVIDGVTGKLIPPRNSVLLASAVAEYLANSDMCKRYGEAGRNMVIEKFGRERVWTALLSEYQTLLGKCWRRRP